jgi:5-(aminomethyl)-3-furanmethanol phosphate kinase
MRPRAAPRPLVAKLGGSLAGTPALADWIAALDLYPNPLVIVPGGSGFADAVRTMQKKMHFDDDAAHHIALVAMEQYGLALAALWPRLAMTSTPAAIARALRTGRIACWAPAQMAMASALPKSWDVTSDSLAAWLAAQLRAEQLLLVKSAAIDEDAGMSLPDFANAGIVDRLFPHFAAASGADTFIAGPSALPDAVEKLSRNQIPGLRPRHR